VNFVCPHDDQEKKIGGILMQIKMLTALVFFTRKDICTPG